MLDRFRTRAWKVVGFFQGIHRKVDAQMSRILGIRSLDQLEKEQVQEVDMRFLEIFRRVIGPQVAETALKTFQYEASLAIVTSFGMPIIGSSFFALVVSFEFLAGILKRLGAVYQEKEKRDQRLAQQNVA